MLPRTAHPQISGAPSATVTPHSWSIPPSRDVRPEARSGVPRLYLVPAPSDARPEVSSPDACWPPQPEVVRLDRVSGAGPQLGRMTDAEQAAVDDLFRQASRLSAIFAWGVPLTLLVLLVLLVQLLP